MPSKPLELRLLDVLPDRLDVAEVLTLLKAYRDALVSTIVEPDALHAAPAVALVGIKKGSSRFQIRVAARLRVSVSTISRAVLANDFTKLPAETRRSLKAMVASLKAAGRNLELPAFRGKKPLLSGSAAIHIKDSESYSGMTTLFGRIRLTGGGSQDQGRAELVLGDGTVVRLVASKTLIKQLAENLYDEVGVNGIAKWDSLTNVPFQMDVNSIQKFSEGDPFERLANAVGNHWDDVNIEQYVADLRSE